MGSVIENEKTKEKCQIFTPDDIVKSMLNHLGYSDHLYGKTILESSCGNGQFLKEIVIRLITNFLLNSPFPIQACLWPKSLTSVCGDSLFLY